MDLLINKLSYSYSCKDKLILKDIELEVNNGCIISIVGDNGSGKTTLLKILAGIIEVEKEKVKLNGHLVGTKEYKSLTAYIPAIPIVFDSLTGNEHAGLFVDLWEIKEKKNYTNRFRNLADTFGIAMFLNNKVSTYSLGTKYKLFFICMVARNPKLILMDEPLTSLDENSQKEAKEILLEIAKEAVIIFASHQKEIIIELSSVLYKIEDTKLINI